MRKSALGVAILLWLAGCSTYITEQRPAWRAEAENACLARNAVQESAFLRASHEINGPGICGLTHPFKVTALADGTVTMNSTATIGCPMIEALDSWIKEVVQPAAQARFGEPVVRINSMGSYSCRGINNMSGAKLSEHGFGNAIDIGGFVLASGRELNVMRGFNGSDEQERAFLHEAHAEACGHFTTVLGPGYNIFHYNHFHLDLAMHGSTSRGARRYCKPVPQKALPEPPKRDDLPDPPAIEEELDIARAGVPAPLMSLGSPAIVASAPTPRLTSRSAAYAPLSRRKEGIVGRGSVPAEGPNEPPLVTFSQGGADPEPAGDFARGSRGPGATSPRRASNPQAEAPDGDGGRSFSAEVAPDRDGGSPEADPVESGARAEPGARSRKAATIPDPGAPADWDITSSIR